MTTSRHRLPRLVIVAGVVHAFVMVLVLHRHDAALGHAGEAAYIAPIEHWLRDSLLYVPVGVVLLAVATLLASQLTARWSMARDGLGAVLLWAGLGAATYALASVPASMAHAALFTSAHTEAPSAWQAAQQAVLTLRYSFAVLVAFAMVTGLPWAPRRRAGPVLGRFPADAAPTVRDR